MDGLHVAGPGAVVDEVVLGLLGDEPGVRQLLPAVAVEGGLYCHLNLPLQDAAADGIGAGSVGHGQSGGLPPRGGDRHLQDVWDDADALPLHLVGDSAELEAREEVSAHQ